MQSLYARADVCVRACGMAGRWVVVKMWLWGQSSVVPTNLTLSLPYNTT